MPLSPLPLLRADEVEAKLDQAFADVPLPASGRHQAHQWLFRVAEDLHRYLLVEAAAHWMTEADYPARSTFLIRVDRYKYSMRLALARAASLPDAAPDTKAKLDHDAFEACVQLLMAAEDYAEVVRIFSLFRGGDPSLQIDTETQELVEATGLRQAQYAAFELLIHPTNNKLTPLAYLLAAFAGPTTRISETEEAVWAEWLRLAVDRSSARRGTLKLFYPRHATRNIFDELQQLPNSLPDQWSFPWGSAEACKRFFDALASILIYHSIVVHFGALKHQLPGRAFHQFCLETNRQWIVAEISGLSGMSALESSAILEALTYGQGVANPDPALQPVIPTDDEDSVLLPPIFTISNNWPRNLLSLHARVDPRSFDGQSEIFEQLMVEDLRRIVAPHHPHVWSNITIKTREGREEIDLLVADVTSSTFLLCELRWMVQPGDVREVVQRQRALREKTVQLERKCHGLSSSLRDATKKLGVGDSSWKVVGLVIVDGFGGVESPKPEEFPIVPKLVLVEAIGRIPSLRRLQAILCTPVWLPRDGADVEFVRNEVTYFGVTISRDGFRAGTDRYTDNLAKYLTATDALSEGEIRAIRWQPALPSEADIGDGA